MIRRLFLLLVLGLGVESHEHHDHLNCHLDPNLRFAAEYRPGIVTLDGNPTEWASVHGFDLDLLPALDPDQDKAYPAGKITIKSLHDGNHVYFLLQVDGDYAYTKSDSKKCPSVALMFQVGESATYNDMGGCKERPGSCTNKTCRGHEVDLMHFSIGTAIPGRLYGSNPLDNSVGYGGDRYGHLVDLYAWNPHCRYVDGTGPSGNDTSAQNNWQGAWWHSTLKSTAGFIEEDSPYSSSAGKGSYYFEFSRPLRTSDRLRQDVQFVVGQQSKFSAAFWYPNDGNPWSGSEHYTSGCDWLPIDVLPASGSSLSHASSKGNQDAMAAFSLLLSFLSIGVSTFIFSWVIKRRAVPFTPIDNPMRTMS